MSDEARRKLESLTPQQRLENLEYLTFRLFMQSTELPCPEDDLAYARAGAKQILQQVGGDVSIPHLLHAIRAQIEKFNRRAERASRKREAENSNA